MSGGSRRTARNRGRPLTRDGSDGRSHRDSRPVDAVRKVRSRDHGPIRLMDVSLKTLLWLGFGVVAFISVFLLIYKYHWESRHESPALRRLERVVTPLQAPKMMDLAQVRLSSMRICLKFSVDHLKKGEKMVFLNIWNGCSFKESIRKACTGAHTGPMSISESEQGYFLFCGCLFPNNSIEDANIFLE